MTTFLAVLALVVALVALVVAGQRYLRERTSGSAAAADGDHEAGPSGRSVAKLEGAINQLASNQKKLADLAQASVRHVGVVRFDAFEDMGGRLSFSAALLDGRGDGVVITSINGRQDTRCYAKQVENWTSIHNLSDEERQAIREALGKAEHRAAAR